MADSESTVGAEANANRPEVDANCGVHGREITLVGFAYGEDLEQGSGRSLGYRLLAPPSPSPFARRGEAGVWTEEVEGLARRLQAAPYPDHWPAADLFCSVLLADGRRLVALARYGLADHTPSQRRGGLELVGMVGPANLEVQTALTLYRWLQHRRGEEDDLHRLGGSVFLDEILAQAPPGRSDGAEMGGLSAPVPVLPVRIWHEGAFLFAASAPGDPDHHLRLLEMGTKTGWQWLPLIGPDFPLSRYAQRGPVVAWTPHLAGVALKLDSRPSERPPLSPPPPRRETLGSRLLAAVVLGLVILVGLLGGNLWYLYQLHQQIVDLKASPQPVPEAVAKQETRPTSESDEAARERFIAALYRVLVEQSGDREWTEAPWATRAALLDRYQDLASQDRDLRLPAGNDKGRVLVAAVSILSNRSADRIEETVRKALRGKGFDDKLVTLACEQIREQFRKESKERP